MFLSRHACLTRCPFSSNPRHIRHRTYPPSGILGYHQCKHLQRTHSNFVTRAHQLEAEAVVSMMGVFYTGSRLSANVGRGLESKFSLQLHNLLVDVELLTVIWLGCRTVEEACQRSLNHFPCPGLAFPMPALDFDFRIAVRLNQDAVHVDSGNTKEITTVAAGVWSGSFGHGRVIVRFFLLLSNPLTRYILRSCYIRG
jgi:hypothetical protein